MEDTLNLILANVGKHIMLTPTEKETFLQLLTLKQLNRKQYLLQQGEICRYSAFVLSGCLRGYTLDRNGFEHVLNFAPADWWIADMHSLITHQPGTLNIEALEETQVLLLSKTNQEELYARLPKFERFFRILTEKSLIAYQQRMIDNLSLTASERYTRFCQRYPTLIHHLPQKQIAAYIGVTPEFFSKMKKEM